MSMTFRLDNRWYKEVTRNFWPISGSDRNHTVSVAFLLVTFLWMDNEYANRPQ